MRIKRIAVYLLMATVVFGTVSCKKSAAEPKVTEENFRSFPQTDGSMFNYM